MEAANASWWSRPCGGREVLRLALPLVVSTVSWTLLHFIDRMFLTWHSKEALAASMPAMMVWWTAICFPLGICTYVNTFVAQYHGAGRPERIGESVWQGVWVGLAFAPLVLLTAPLAGDFFAWIGHTAEIARLEAVYYEILCWCGGSMFLSAALESYFTGRGHTKTVALVNLAAAGANIALDYAWIFGHWGFPAWGLEGAAWATVAAHWLKTSVYFVLFLRPVNRRAHGTLSGCRVNGELFRRLLRFGGPSGAQLVLEVFGYTAFVLLIGRLGELELAASNLAFNISSLAFMPILGLGIAVNTLVGQRLGQDRDDLAAQATWSALRLGVIYMAAISLVYLLAPGLLLAGHFAAGRNVTELQPLAVVLLRFVAAFNLADALGIVFVNAIKGAGDTRFVLRVTVGMSAALVALAWLSVEVWRLSVYGLWSVITLWLWAMGLIFAARFVQGNWRHMRVIEKEREELVPAA